MTTTANLVQEYEAALQAVIESEKAGQSKRTQDRKYRRLFAAQDALKAQEWIK